MSLFIICCDAAGAGEEVEDEVVMATTGLGIGVLTNLCDPGMETRLELVALLNLSLSMLSDTTFSICQTSAPTMNQTK